MFARLKARGAVAAVLVSALVAGGAFVGGGAAYAAEPEPTAVSEAPAVSTEETTPAVEAETAPAAGETSSPEVTEGDAQNESADQGSDAAPAEDAGAATDEAPATDAEDAAAADDKAVTTEKPAAKTAARAAKAALPESLEALRENGGQLSWNFLDSWVTYLGYAGATITPYGGATGGANGLVNFPEATSTSYNAKTRVGEIAYTGGVEWDNPAHGFTIVMQNPRVTVAADGSAVLSAEMSTSDTAGAGDVTRIDVATLPALGEGATEDNARTWTAIGATFATPLSPTGISRYAGKPASAVTFSTYVQTLPKQLEGVRTNGGELSWNFLDSWVTYLGFAKATITPYGGATGGAKGMINFPESTATTYNPKTRVGEIAYTGGVEWDNPAHGFTIAMQNIRVVVAKDGTATVKAELSKTNEAGAFDVQQIELAKIDALGEVTEADELRHWTAVSTTFAADISPDGISRYSGKPASPMTFSTVSPSLPKKLEEIREDGGSMSWNFLDSWVTYLNYSKATISAYGGATAGEKGMITFPESTETKYDLKTGVGQVTYTGGVEWNNPAHGFTIAMQNPRVTIGEDGSAVLSAEMSANDNAGADDVVRIDVATIAVDGTVADTEDFRSWEAAKATFASPLSPNGISRDAGKAASDVTFSTMIPGLPKKLEDVRTNGGSMEWNFLDSWVTYLTYAKGTIKAYGGATGGEKGMISFPESAQTSYDPETGVGEIAYTGGVEWDNPAHGFNIVMQNPRITVSEDGSAVMTAETSTTDTAGYRDVTRVTVANLPALGTAANNSGVRSWTAVAGVFDKDLAPSGISRYAGKASSPVTFATRTAEVPTTPEYGDPEIRVFKADGITPLGDSEVYEGETIVVKGTGFDPYVNKGGHGQPIPADKPQGTFLVFGSFADNWKPSEGAKGSQRTFNKDSRGWMLAEDTLENDVLAEYRDEIRSQWVELDPTTGGFTAKLTVKAPISALSGGNYGVYTYSGSLNTSNAAQELRTLVTFKGNKPVEPEPEVPTPEAKVGDLQWGIMGSFVNYVNNIAEGGKITVSGSATEKNGIFKFVQTKGGNWDAKKGTGEIRYSGSVFFTGHGDKMNVLIKDPRVTVKSKNKAVLSATMLNAKGKEVLTPLADLTLPEKGVGKDGAVTWTGATATLRAEAVEAFDDMYAEGRELDKVTFTAGSNAENVKPTKPVTPTKPKPTKPTEKPKPIVVPQNNSKQPGSLTWGVSSGFAGYTTGKIAKGSVTSDGVGRSGGAYVFPQASSSWNTASQTGTVQFSGVVTFTGHNGAMVETFSNPVITVNSASSATMNAGGRTFTLDLGSASKVVGSNGEVTWNGVPVGGVISGGGSAGGGSGAGSFSADPLSFTVGAANGTSYGSTEQTAPSTKRTAADAPPATTGITLITDKKKLVAGAEVEFEASGFEPNERDILVVVYSDPIVLDDAAGADENGVVRWIGNLPKDLKPGEHTLTLQGSKNAGVKITVLSKEEAKKAKATADNEIVTAQSASVEKAAAGDLAATGSMLWLWWTAAILLLILAVVGAALVVRQRRTIE